MEFNKLTTQYWNLNEQNLMENIYSNVDLTLCYQLKFDHTVCLPVENVGEIALVKNMETTHCQSTNVQYQA